MRRSLCLTVIFLAASVATASAQKAAGTWNGKTMMGPKDSVVATYTMTIAADGKTASMKFLNRDAIPARVVAMGGDSVVTEMGPYSSVLRAGETVNQLRSVSHIKGDMMSGTFEARYAKGDVVKGKMSATRAK